MLRWLPEAPGHVPARETLLDCSFGSARHRKTCEKLRRGQSPAAGLAFALLDDRKLIGTLRFWHIVAGSAGPALLLGPVAVAPERRGEGLGALMMERGLAAARMRGHAAVLLVGDAPYYERFGFRQELTQGLVMPGPVERERFLGLELLPGALAGAHGAVSASAPVGAGIHDGAVGVDARSTAAAGAISLSVSSLPPITETPSPLPHTAAR